MKTCPICSGSMKEKCAQYTFYCRSCDYWASNLPYDITNESDAVFNEKDEEGDVLSFLDSVRTRNFEVILQKIEEDFDGTVDILDVGCATGLFVTVASTRSHNVVGLEPNPKMAAAARRNGHNVLHGYFPGAMDSKQKFDVIIFNDVFEHIPDIAAIVEGVSAHLKPEGMLVINLPNSHGVLFRIGGWLSRLGITTLWDRLWQKMFYTPHLHYFCADSLNKFLTLHSFSKSVSHIYLPVLSREGLWERVRADRATSVVKRLLIYTIAILAIPLLKFFEPDIIAVFYRKHKS